MDIFVKYEKNGCRLFLVAKSEEKGFFWSEACRTHFERQYLRNEAIYHIAVFTPNSVILRGIRLANKQNFKDDASI